MKARLTERQIKYAVTQCEKGRRTADVAVELKVTQRRIQQLWAEFRGTGKYHVQRKAGRPHRPITPEEVRAVLDVHKSRPVGVVHTTRALRANHHITYQHVYHIMKEHGMVVPSEAKSRKRKWIRYERIYSNAMWHVDWHDMKDQRFAGLKLVTYLDDASRCVLAARLFREATSQNAVLALRDAVKQFGIPATILSDNGACFVGRGNRRADGGKPPSSWTPTAFESELLDLGIELINSRPYHPQTNGKLERFHRSIEEEIWHYESLSAYIQYYNEVRLHFSLDIDNLQTPLRAFSDKRATDEVRRNNPKWMEEDINGQAK